MIEKKPHILLAEDDTNLGVLLSEYLMGEGFDITHFSNGDKALNEFKSDKFDLCLLDVMMPKVDGFTLARFIRKKEKKIPIIFITAKFLKEDKLEGYKIGADDYITKPFDEDELLWKIKAILRRRPTTQKLKTIPVIAIGKYTFDYHNQLLTLKNESRRITEKETKILYYISGHRNSVIKRDQMLEEIWGSSDYFSGRSLDVFITKIRKYLKDDPNLSIENVYGVGFIFKTT